MIMSIDFALLADRIAVHAAHLDAATHTLLSDLRTFDSGGGWHRQGALSCAHWLSWRVGWSLGTAREHVRVARRLGELPLIDDALRRGALSYCKARALTRVATTANESLLLDDAQAATGSQLEQICRKYAAVVRASQQPEEAEDRERRYVRRVDLDDGMVRIEAVLFPEEAASVWAALEGVARASKRAATEQASAVEAASGAAADAARDVGDASAHAHAAANAPGAAEDLDASEDLDAAEDLDASEGLDASEDLDVHSRGFDSAGVLDMLDVLDGHHHGADSRNAVSASRGSIEAALVRARAATRERRAGETRSRFDRADALVTIARDILRGDRIHATPVELIVTVTADTLAHPMTTPYPFAVTKDGTCVSAETARRLACDCGVVHVREDESGTPLSVGRKTRTISASLKRALLKRDKTCRFPGCCNQVFVEGHHIVHWAGGGETSLDNLVGLCSHHHRFVHEYGYRVELDAEHQPRFFDPRGRLVSDVPERPTTVRLGMQSLIDDHRALNVSAETNEPGWDGLPVNYDWVIGDLVRADQLQ